MEPVVGDSDNLRRGSVQGVTTGYGPLATVVIAPERAAELNDPRLPSGERRTAHALPPDQARAVAVARLAALAATTPPTCAKVL